MKKRVILFMILVLVMSVFFACNPKVKPIHKYQLKVQVEGQGKVEPSSGLYEMGTSISFDIIPSEGWQFSAWAGESLGDVKESEGTWKILMNSDKKLTAIFVEIEKPKEYSLNVTVKGKGTVEPNSGKFEEGSIVIFDIKPEKDWFFKEWNGKDRKDLQEIEGKWQVTMDSSKTIEAVFAEELKAIYSLEVTISGSGTIVKSPNEELYKPSTVVTLQAIPHTGWYFVKWSGDQSGTADEMKVTMDSNKSILAEFAANEYSLIINTQGEGEVLVENKTKTLSTYPHNTELILTAQASKGWAFKEWRGDLTSKNPSETLLMNSEKEVTAVFERLDYNLEIEIIGEGKVQETVLEQSQGEYPYATLVQLEAIPAKGWEFEGWSGDLKSKEALVKLLIDDHKKVQATFKELIYHELIIEIDGQGTVSQNPQEDKYLAGSKVTLTAKPAANWLFTGWSGAIASPKETVEVVMDSKKTITANFEIMEFSLTINVEGQGKVEQEVTRSKSKDYPYGTKVLLTASPDKGWEFVEWRGDVQGNKENIELVMDDHKTVTAVFNKLNYYELSLITEGQGTIKLEPEESKYLEGSSVTLTAQPAAGWLFANWSGDLEGQDLSKELVMTSNKKVTAHFAKKDYSLEITITGEGKGKVEERIIKGTSKDYPFETLVELKAIAEPGSKFIKWSGDASGTEPVIEILMDSNKKVTAVFAKIPRFELTVEVKGEGDYTLDPDEKDYPEGSTVELTANAATGWMFESWSGDAHGTESLLTIKMDKDKTITLTFVRAEYDLSTDVIGSGQIIVGLIAYPDGTDYPYQTKIQLTAVPDRGSKFVRWEGDASGNENPLVVEIDRDKKITAIFKEIPRYTLTVEVKGEGSCIKDPDQLDYERGSTVTLTPQAATGWLFGGWEDLLSLGNEIRTITMDSDKKLILHFTKQEYSLIVKKTGEGRVTDENGKEIINEQYFFEDRVRLTATPANGWEFTGWTGFVDSSDPEISFQITDNVDLHATFTLKRYMLTIKPSVGGKIVDEKGQELISQEYDHGTMVKMWAEADISEEYRFKEWKGAVSGSNPETRVTIDGPKEVEAVFEKIPRYVINVKVEGQGGYTKNPDQGTYLEDTSVHLEAMPLKGWEFQGWSGDATSDQAGIDLVMDADKSLKLSFARIKYTLKIETRGDGYVEKGLIDYPLGVDYPYQTRIQLRAKANAGSRFLRWEGDVSGTASQIVVEMDNDKTVIAVFEVIPRYNLIVNCNEGGTYTKSPEENDYEEGTKVTLTAIPLEGWEFDSWSPDDLANGNASFTVTMDDHKEFDLNFRRKLYNLEITKIGQGKITDADGNELGAKDYPFETTVNLKAEPTQSWEFIKWTEDAQGTEITTNIYMDGNKKVTAIFEKIPRYVLTVNVVGNGSFTKNPDQDDYERGTEVKLTAQADYGWEFSTWTGILAGTAGNASVIMNSDKEVGLIFVKTNFTLTVSELENGQILDSTNNPLVSGEYLYESQLELKAVPNPGWKFQEWTGDLSGTDEEATLLMDGPKTIGAVFTEIPKYTLTVIIQGTSVGTVDVEPKKDWYYEGEIVKLTAKKGFFGANFKEWLGDYKGKENPIYITMTKNMTITARYSGFGFSDGEGEELED